MIILVHHRQDLIYMIGKYLIQHMDVKFVPGFHLIDIGKKSGTRQTSVCRQHCMITFSSNRKLRTVQMSDSGLKYIIAGSMINCKFDIDLRNGQISHHSVVFYIQDLPVICILQITVIFAKHISVEIIVGNGLIKGFRFLPRLSTNRMSIGISIVARTRAKQGPL